MVVGVQDEANLLLDDQHLFVCPGTPWGSRSVGASLGTKGLDIANRKDTVLLGYIATATILFLKNQVASMCLTSIEIGPQLNFDSLNQRDLII